MRNTPGPVWVVAVGISFALTVSSANNSRRPRARPEPKTDLSLTCANLFEGAPPQFASPTRIDSPTWLIPRPTTRLGTFRGATLYWLKGQSAEAKFRPVSILIPPGPGLSYRTMLPLQNLAREFDVVFIDPPAVGPRNYFPQARKLGNNYDQYVKQIAEAIWTAVQEPMRRSWFPIGFSQCGQ